MTEYEEMRQKAADRRAMIMAAIIRSNSTASGAAALYIRSVVDRNELVAMVIELERGINT